MIAEIISTGEEVITGSVVDSNAAYIAARLHEIGVPVGRHVCVGDDLEKITDVLAEAGQRSDIGIVSGGLGPTVDDITAKAAAKAADVDLHSSPEARAYVEEFFRRFNRPLSKSDEKQADLPAGARPILNSVGTAPGFYMSIGGCRFYFLPGVPFEMRRMMSDSVIPAIKKLYCRGQERRSYHEKRFSLFGLPESQVNERLEDLTAVPGDVTISMLSEFPVIHVKLSAYGKDPNRLSAAIENVSAVVMDRIGKFVYSDSGKTMEEAVGELLAESSGSLALAESCTGGLIGHRITNVAGSSGYFAGSIVTYTNEAKMSLLGVSADTLETYGAVSEEVAREMAEGSRSVLAAEYGLSVSGIAGPGGGTAKKPVGTVCIGLCGPGTSFAKRCYFPFDNRLANKRIFAEAALDTLRRRLVGGGELEYLNKGD